MNQNKLREYFTGERQLPTKSFEINEVSNKPAIGDEEADRERDFTQPSSFVGKVTYTPDLQTMEVSLNGNTYNFCKVSERIFDSFEGAGSKGKYFNNSIKGQFDC